MYVAARLSRAVRIPKMTCSACAVASKTNIISGDKDLLCVSGYKDIEVLTPRRFVDRYII